MNLEQSLNQISSLLTNGQKGLVLIASEEADSLAAGVSLALSLEASGKQMAVFAPRLPAMKMPFLSGLEKVRADLGQKDLIIDLNYPLESIDKVSSQEEGNRLKLIVKVKPEAEAIKPDQVKIVAQDLDYQMGILIGDGRSFANFDQVVNRGKWIWLSKIGAPDQWAQVSLVDSQATYSEIAARIIQGLGLPMDRSIASNLFEGIKRGTNSFEQIGSYRTLETAALCYKVIQPNGEKKAVGEKAVEAPPIESVEAKEGPSGLPSPKIFKGATTPRV